MQRDVENEKKKRLNGILLVKTTLSLLREEVITETDPSAASWFTC